MEYCGRETAVQILGPDGQANKVDQAEIKDAEDYFDHLPILTNYLLTSLETHHDDMLDSIVDLIKQEILLFRDSQEKRQERREQAKKMLAATRLKKQPDQP